MRPISPTIREPTSRTSKTHDGRSAFALRARRHADVSGGLRNDDFGARSQRGAVRRIPSRPLRRRGDRRRETVSADRRRSRFLRREGLSAASGRSSNGLRPEYSHSSDRVSDRPRGRWPRDVVSKRAAHAGRARAPLRNSPRRCSQSQNSFRRDARRLRRSRRASRPSEPLAFARWNIWSFEPTKACKPLQVLDRPARLLVAAWLGDTRLIDNVKVSPRRARSAPSE